MKDLYWNWPDHLIVKRESRRLKADHNALVTAYLELVKACEFSKELLVSPAIRKLCLGDRILCELPVRPDVLRDAVNLRIECLTKALVLAQLAVDQSTTTQATFDSIIAEVKAITHALEKQ